MAARIRDPRLENREARLKLRPRKEPYWRSIHRGLAVGYYRSNAGRGGAWWVRAHKQGGFQRHSLAIADDFAEADGREILSYQQATRRAIELADRTNGLGERLKDVDLTVSDILADYFVWYEAHRKIGGYKESKRMADAHIIPSLGSRRATNLTTKELRRWHEKLATAPARIRGKSITRKVDPQDSDGMRKRRATANRILTVLKAALNHAHELGSLPSADAWRRVKPFRGVDSPKVRYLTESQCGRLLEACPADLHALVRGALSTGARLGELTNLRVADFDAQAGTITIREAKGGQSRHVPLTNDGCRFFTAATSGKSNDNLIFTRSDRSPWTKGHQVRPLRRACATADINPPIGFHVLRHTYGSLLAAKGVPLQVIAKALGHADTRMTERHYAHLSDDYIKKMLREHLPSFGKVDHHETENHIATLEHATDT